MRFPLAFAAAGAIVAAVPAAANPQLLQSTPVANATVAPTANVRLAFSERVAASLSTVQVVMTGMPGMADHPPMPMPGKVAITADGKTVTVTFARPLATGSYKVNYQIAASAGGKVQGSLDFKVR